MTVIDYYISLNSPWTYLGAAQLTDILARHGASARVKPARFGEVFERTGGLPLPKRAPERQAYRLVELKRWSEWRKMPLTIKPKHFPSDETKATRLVIAADRRGLDALRFSLELGRALWEREESLADDDAIAAAGKRAGIDLVGLGGAAEDASLDAVWDQNTKEAVARGVFGAPSYVLPSGEIFWGQDRLEFLDRALARGA